MSEILQSTLYDSKSTLHSLFVKYVSYLYCMDLSLYISLSTISAALGLHKTYVFPTVTIFIIEFFVYFFSLHIFGYQILIDCC